MILFINSKSEETCVGSMFLSDYIIILLLFFLQSNKLDSKIIGLQRLNLINNQKPKLKHIFFVYYNSLTHWTRHDTTSTRQKRLTQWSLEKTVEFRRTDNWLQDIFPNLLTDILQRYAKTCHWPRLVSWAVKTENNLRKAEKTLKKI